jgi:hypothetical protein
MRSSLRAMEAEAKADAERGDELGWIAPQAG